MDPRTEHQLMNYTPQKKPLEDLSKSLIEEKTVETQEVHKEVVSTPGPPVKKKKRKLEKTDMLIIGFLIFILLIAAFMGANNGNLQKQRLCSSHDLIYDDRDFCYSKETSETVEIHEIQKVNGKFVLAKI